MSGQGFTLPMADSSIPPVSEEISAPVGPPVVDQLGARVVAPQDVSNIDTILTDLVRSGGSDLHLSAGAPPMIRVDGELEPIKGSDALTARTAQTMVYSLLSDRQRTTFEEERELDLAYELPGVARFRVNVMQQRGNVGAVLRVIPWEILPLDALNMPYGIWQVHDLGGIG